MFALTQDPQHVEEPLSHILETKHCASNALSHVHSPPSPHKHFFKVYKYLLGYNYCF